MNTRPRARLAFPPPESSPVVVNDRVSCRTEGTERVISVHGVVFAHYDSYFVLVRATRSAREAITAAYAFNASASRPASAIR